MAATVSIEQYLSLGSVQGRIVKVTGDASYPTGGYLITKETLGLLNVMLVAPDGIGTHIPVWDYANSKLKFFYPQGGSAGGLNNCSGTGSIPAGATAVTSNAAQPTVEINSATGREVQAGADLSAVSCRLLVIGV